MNLQGSGIRSSLQTLCTILDGACHTCNIQLNRASSFNKCHKPTLLLRYLQDRGSTCQRIKQRPVPEGA